VRHGARLLLPVFYILLSAAQAPSPAQTGTLGERYQKALEAIEQSQGNETKTRAERDRLQAEAKDLQQRLIETATKVQQLEEASAQTDAELAKLNETARDLSAGLAKDRDQVAHLLAVLQRLSAEEPPALALRPDDSLTAARGTMQLGAMLPPVYEQAAALAKRLKALSETRAAMGKKANEARAQTQALATARVDLDKLLLQRNQETVEAEAKLTEIHGLIEEATRQSKDLKSLIDRIANLRQRTPGNVTGVTVVSPANGDQGGLKRGSLRIPVVGTATDGDPAGPGQTPGATGPSGLWFEAKGQAQAVAPADSAVVFAGTYQKFGQVLILEIMGGYHLTLAGLGRIDVHVGDLVLAGEPVGVLPDGAVARLYMELRRSGQIVDPSPWMSAELRKAKGT
jgi:septal ring factor EnvC (AmiA/AmiB activator)